MNSLKNYSLFYLVIKLVLATIITFEQPSTTKRNTEIFLQCTYIIEQNFQQRKSKINGLLDNKQKAA